MAYYSMINLVGLIKPKLVNKLKAEVTHIQDITNRAIMNADASAIDRLPVFYFSFILKMGVIETDFKNRTYIDFDEYHDEWVNDEEFIRFIAPYLIEEDITFIGENNYKWGYRINSNGTVTKLFYETRTIEGELL